MGVTACDSGVTATKRWRCNALLALLPRHLPGRRSTLSMGLKTKSWRTFRWQDGTVMDGNRCVVDLSWNVLLSDWFFRRPGFSFWRATPLALALAGLAGPLRLDDLISGQPPSRIPKCQGTLVWAPSWQRIMLAPVVLRQHLDTPSSPRAASPCRQMGLRLLLFGCRSCFRDSASVHLALALFLDDISTSWLASPCSGIALTMRLPCSGSVSSFPLFSWGCLYFASAPVLVLRPGDQCLGLSGNGCHSLVSGFDAGGTLGQGWCSAYDRQHSPSFVRINA